MNSRCQKDALDRAEDICELCGLQFCANCLLFPRGHRNPPTCKTCAIQNSGLRGKSASSQPISKREYKKRKKALLEVLESVEDQRPALEFFELQDPSAFDRSSELDRRIAEIEREGPVDILANDDAEVAEVSLAPPAPVAPPPPAPEPQAAAPADDRSLAGLAPVDTSINPLALDDPFAPAAASAPAEPESTEASAADLLARLKADQPIQSQFNNAQPSLDADPFAAPTSELVGPVSTPQPAAPAAPAPAPTTKAAGSWSPPAPPPRGTNLDTSEPPMQPSPLDAPPSFAPEPEPEPDHPKRRAADTDDTGQWIPPSLRGMATPDERPPLPKRR